MPVIRRIAKRQREVLTSRQRGHLLSGWTIGSPDDGSRHFRTREEFQAAWEQHGEELLRGYIAQNPGHRPFGWWLVTHGQERPLNADGQLMESRCGAVQIRWGDRFREVFGFLHSDEFQEDETAYLRRNGLLAPAELKALAALESEG